MTYTEYATANRGTYTVDGVEYVELSEPTLTDRLFPGWWGDASAGEEYISEWACPAASATDFDSPDFDPDDASDPPVTLVFRFPAIKGEEPEDGSNWPWRNDQYITAKRN